MSAALAFTEEIRACRVVIIHWHRVLDQSAAFEGVRACGPSDRRFCVLLGRHYRRT